MGLPRTGAAARANDAGRRIERLGDPRDVEHLRGGANGGGGALGNHTVAAAAPAGLGDRRDRLFTVEALGIERRQQIDAHGEHMHFIQRVARQQ